jgi:ATP-binding cassette subfamily B protein
MIATVQALWLVCVTAFRVSRVQTLIALGETLARMINGLNPLFYGYFVSGAVHHDLRRMAVAVLGLLCSSGVNQAIQMVGNSARIQQHMYVGFEFTRQITLLMSSIETLDHHEDPKLLDKLQAFRDWSGDIGRTLNAMLNGLGTLAWSTTTVVVAVTADWRLLVLAVLGVPRLVVVPWTVRWDKAAEESGSPPRRLADRLVDLSHDPDAGAEARVFGLRPIMLRRLTQSLQAWQGPDVRRIRNHAALDLANGVLYFGSATAIIGWILADALEGRVSITAVTIAVTSLNSLQQVSSYIASTVKWVAEEARSAVRFVWLRGYAAEVRARHTGSVPAPHRLRSGIRLEQLRFRYTGAADDALAGLDVELPAGTVVAVVGDNGAGKSTLVKLLTGMYRPTGGRILVDGVDLASIDLTGWRERCSGAFQDHADFEFTAQETVGIGDVARVGKEAEVRAALDAGAASEVLTALPEGLQTQLGSRWAAGVDLSGGQWQRLAIARGMMRPDPLLLVLDEPTSALDAPTEHALFDRYAATAEQARRRGAVTLLVTHRFSTVAAADLVLVMDRGRIVETGSHTDLIEASGTYAELYELQARGYR